jgi:hypothetical protein
MKIADKTKQLVQHAMTVSVMQLCYSGRKLLENMGALLSLWVTLTP